MKKTILLVLMFFVIFPICYYCTPLHSTKTVEFSTWLNDYKLMKTAERKQVPVFVRVYKKNTPNEVYELTNNDPVKLSRLLQQLKVTEVFDFDVDHSQDTDFIVQVQSEDNLFVGGISQKKVVKNVRAQVLLKLIELS